MSRKLKYLLFAITLAATLQVLAPVGVAAPGMGSRPLQQGMQGEDVAELQRLLTEAGVYKGPVTGYFGALTLQAVQQFQRAKGLPAFGYVGPLTVKALQATQPEQHHVVAPGENLSLIAARYGVTVEEIVRQNSLRNPQLLLAGQKLLIRGPAKPAASQAATPPVPAKNIQSREATQTPSGVAARPDPLRVYQPKPPAATTSAQPTKVLALTFDDGPDPVLTPQVLDLLAKYRAQATFFVVGRQAERHPELLKRMLEEGHEIANHSYSHRDLTQLPPEAMIQDLQSASRVIEGAAAKPPAWFRPPTGNFDDRLVEAATRSGMRLALWTNIGPQKLSAPLLTKRTLSAAREGAILMLHDTEPQTLEALAEILPKLTASYRLVTLSKMAGLN